VEIGYRLIEAPFFLSLLAHNLVDYSDELLLLLFELAFNLLQKTLFQLFRGKLRRWRALIILRQVCLVYRYIDALLRLRLLLHFLDTSKITF